MARTFRPTLTTARGRAALTLSCVAVASACGGADGPDWEPRFDPLLASANAVEYPTAEETTGLGRLQDDLEAGTVSLEDAFRYRLALHFGLGDSVPAAYARTEGERDSDLILEEIAAALDEVAPGARAELEAWTLPWADPRHPLGSRARRSVAAAEPDGARFVRASTAPQLCPQDPLVGGSTLLVGAEDLFCWAKPNIHTVVYWVRDDTRAQELYDVAAPIMSEAAPILDHHLDLFSASPAELIYRSGGEESIFIGLWTESQLDIEMEDSYLGVHHWNEPERRSYVEVVVADSGGPHLDGWRKATLAHELFHAMQWQLLEQPAGNCYGKFEAYCYWAIEGMASWSEKQYLGNAAADIPALITNKYHPRMRRFIETDDSIQKGVDQPGMKYAAHLLWHELVARQGLQAIKGALLLYESDGRNETLYQRLDLANSWHDTAKHFYHREPWKRMTDSPTDLPEDMQIGIGVLFFTSDASFDVEELTLPRVSALRATASFVGGNTPPFVQVRLDSPHNGAPLEGVQMSVVLPDTDQGFDLDIGATQIICFDGSDPMCEQETVYPSAPRIDLIISNANYELPEQEALLTVATLPIEFTATSIKVGDTESTITGDLTMIRKTDDTIELEAESVWFEFDDAFYDRNIPEESTSDTANISPALIREYVKSHAEFRGFMELEFDIDEDKDPTEEDGLWWVDLETQREEQGNFFATPHRFFVRDDPAWFEALGGGSGALGPGGIVYQRMIYQLNRTEYPEGSFAHTLQGYFTQAMTLGTGQGETGTPRYSIDSATRRLYFRMGNTTLTLEPQ